MFTGFMDDDSYDCGPLSVRQVRAFEARQGFELPSSYVSILAARNGGVPRETFCPTEFPTSWSPEGFEIDAIWASAAASGASTGSKAVTT